MVFVAAAFVHSELPICLKIHNDLLLLSEDLLLSSIPRKFFQKVGSQRESHDAFVMMPDVREVFYTAF